MTDKTQIVEDLQGLGLLLSGGRMPNEEVRVRLKTEDGIGYVCTMMDQGREWQEAHYHEYLRELYIVERGWICCAELVNDQLVLSRLGAGQSVTIEPGTIHNIYMTNRTKVHTVKYPDGSDRRGVRSVAKPEKEDRIVTRATEGFTRRTQALQSSEILRRTRYLNRRYFVLVSRDARGMVPVGLIEPKVAHDGSVVAGPHASVIIMPFRLRRNGTVEILIHLRPTKKTCPNQWDVFGGHVEVGCTEELFKARSAASRHQLRKAIIDTAVREAAEELLIANFSWEQTHLHQFGRLGAFEYGVTPRDSANAEYSTLFVAHIDSPQAKAGSIMAHDTLGHGRTISRHLKCRFQTLDILVDRHAQRPDRYADGLGRLLEWLKAEDHMDIFKKCLRRVAIRARGNGS